MRFADVDIVTVWAHNDGGDRLEIKAQIHDHPLSETGDFCWWRHRQAVLCGIQILIGDCIGLLTRELLVNKMTLFV